MLRYTEIREFNLISFEAVLSQLGGILGLWLGVSVYTVIKAIDKAWKWREKRQQQMLQRSLEILQQQALQNMNIPAPAVNASSG